MNTPLAWFFTDFGSKGPYPGLMRNALLARCPQARVIDLMHDAPVFDPRAGAVLLGALLPDLPPGGVLVGVVDPGVGSERQALHLCWAGRHLLGPDNGLLAAVLAHPELEEARVLEAGAPLRSASFHGRDLFAPAAGDLLCGRRPPGRTVAPETLVGYGWPQSLARILYFDGYGNAMTGLRAEALPPHARLEVAGHRFPRARTFSDVPPGRAFWYANSLGLAEIAVNQGRADRLSGIVAGAPVKVLG